MAAAQTVTAAVCCQTLRGEEGKKNKHEVMDCFFFSLTNQRHFKSSPLLGSISRAVVDITVLQVCVCKMNHCASFCRVNSNALKLELCTFREVKETFPSGAKQERVARLCSCPAAACQRAPVEGSFWNCSNKKQTRKPAAQRWTGDFAKDSSSKAGGQQRASKFLDRYSFF